MADDEETYTERLARLHAETPDQRRARWLAEKDHNRDGTGHYIKRSRLPDGAVPSDPLSGVSLDSTTKPWHHHVDHPDYEPHPESVAALQQD